MKTIADVVLYSLNYHTESGDFVNVGHFKYSGVAYVSLYDVMNAAGMRSPCLSRLVATKRLFRSSDRGIAAFSAAPVFDVVKAIEEYKIARNTPIRFRHRLAGVGSWLSDAFLSPITVDGKKRGEKEKKAKKSVSDRLASSSTELSQGDFGVIEHTVLGKTLTEITPDYISRTHSYTAACMPDESLFKASDIGRLLNLSEKVRAVGLSTVFVRFRGRGKTLEHTKFVSLTELTKYLKYASRKPEARALLEWLETEYKSDNKSEPVTQRRESPVREIESTTRSCIEELKAIRSKVDELLNSLDTLI
jgi:hypothetical protein